MQRLITSLVRTPARALELSSKHRTAAMTSTKLLRASQMKAQIETRKGKENLHVFSSMGERREGAEEIKEGESKVWESRSQTAEGFRSTLPASGAIALSAQWGCEQRNPIGC